MEKIVKVRKDHECCYCGGKIKKGSKAQFMSFREPRFKETDDPFDEEQVGINYVSLWHHDDIDICEAKIMKDN